jgi:A/G-specific adenine glycosylase
MQKIAKEKSRKFVNELLAWSENNLKGFEWRQTSDPYKILVSELLLQKTQADQVTAVYGEFFCKFPTPNHLAEAPVEEIEEIIGLLGLRYRAIRLKKIAEELVDKCKSQVPNDREQLLKHLRGEPSLYPA